VSRPPPSPDFASLIRDLNRAGLNRSDIARQLHVSRATVCRWLIEDRRPSFDNGVALLGLVERVKPK